MNSLQFTLISQTKEDLTNQIQAANAILQTYGSTIDYYIRDDRKVSYEDGIHNYRVDVEVRYPKYSNHIGIKKDIIRDINTGIYPMVYYLNGRRLS